MTTEILHEQNQPLISVVTVCYNASTTIEATIQSVINQTYPHIEYIIIDGGSTDGTVDIIKQYANRITYWVSEPDKGIYDAMNKGVKYVTGDLVYFIGSGDILLPNVFKSILLSYAPKTILYGNVKFVPSNFVCDGKFNRWKIVRHNIPHQALFYPKSVFEEYRYNLRYRLYADYDLNIRLFGVGKYRFKYIDCVVAEYLEGGASSCISNDPYFWEDRDELIVENLGYSYLIWYYISEIIRKLYRFIMPIK